MPTPSSWSSPSSVPFAWKTDIEALLGGTRWASSVISYSFPDFGSWWGTDSTVGYGSEKMGAEPWSTDFLPLTATDQLNFRSALAAWSNVANVQFVQTLETSTNVGDIRVAYTYESYDADAFAWSYLPADTAYAGDIWFNVKSTASSEQWNPGTYSFVSAIHELGHALGLKHPFEGDYVLPDAEDTISQTVMSYSAIAGDDGSWFDFYPTTPMVLDIQAMQFIYGANNTYHAGADNYVFDDSKTYFQTIWDAGEANAISYSGSRSATIDLREGHGSTIGLPVHAYSSTGSVQDVKNIWIAYGTHIQTALGGSGADTLIAKIPVVRFSAPQGTTSSRAEQATTVLSAVQATTPSRAAAGTIPRHTSRRSVTTRSQRPARATRSRTTRVSKVRTRCRMWASSIFPTSRSTSM